MLKFYSDYDLKKTLNMASSEEPQLSSTRASKGICPLAYNEGNHQLKSPNYIDNWPILPILQSSHPNDFLFRILLFRLHNHCEMVYWTNNRIASDMKSPDAQVMSLLLIFFRNTDESMIDLLFWNCMINAFRIAGPFWGDSGGHR